LNTAISDVWRKALEVCKERIGSPSPSPEVLRFASEGEFLDYVQQSYPELRKAYEAKALTLEDLRSHLERVLGWRVEIAGSSSPRPEAPKSLSPEVEEAEYERIRERAMLPPPARQRRFV